MKVTVEIEGELMAQARSFAGTEMGVDAVIVEALKAYVEVEAGRRLGELGGKARDTRDVPRRRF